jgi:polysaccharide export outer membrane protein
MRRFSQGVCRLVPCLLAAALVACSSTQQAPPVTEPSAPDAADIAVPKISDATLGPGDELEIAVWRNPDLGGRYVVGSNGEFFVPLIGAVQTDGVGVTVIREKIVESLRAYLKDPQVTLTVTNYHSRKVFVLGEVQRPGIFSLGNQSMSLVDAIALAGGLTLDGKGKQILRIPVEGRTTGEVEAFDIDKLFKQGDMTQNPRLANGDIIYIPPTTIANVDRFFKHFRNIMEPIVWFERAIVLAPFVDDALHGQGGRGGSVLINSN